MFRIGQLAGIYKISGKTLRYYDELGLLKPQYVDRMTGYRYYTSSQIPTLNEIFLLKEMGLSLKEITYLMQREEENDSTVLKGVLDLKQMELDREIHELLQKKQMIELLKRKLDGEAKVEISRLNVGTKKIEKMKVASLKATISAYSTQDSLWSELLDFLSQEKIKTGTERYTIYYDSVFKGDDIQVEIQKRVLTKFQGNDRIHYKEVGPLDQVAYLLHTGDHESVINAYEAILTWIEENNYEITGNIREEFHMDDFMTNNPEEFVTEIQIPIKKQRTE